MKQSIWKDSTGAFWNPLALSYGIGGYILGWIGLLSGEIQWALPATLILGHSMVISAYLIHECAHNTLFRDNALNVRLGRALCWIVGGCYGAYEGIRHKHVRHHVDRADVVAFDYRNFLQQHPVLLRMVQAAEWCWIPATDVLMHIFVMVAPFWLPAYRKDRALTLRAMAVRGTLLVVVALIQPWALLGYGLAYLVFLQVMRFMDMHQHTYDVSFSLNADPQRDRYDRAFENRNTYSNLLSVRYPWLNLLVLNFGYHNAHHIKPNAPWYRLPKIHQEMPQELQDNVIPLRNLLSSYHKYRVARVLHADPPDAEIGQGKQRGSDFVGVYGVSFLTAL